jgi:transposase
MMTNERDWEKVPEETALLATKVAGRRNIYIKLRQALGSIFNNDAFAELFGKEGRPSEAPWRLALILVFQYLENLSDREAVECVRTRIDWKYALGLRLDDTGFDASVLSEFRGRLVEGDKVNQLLDAFLKAMRDQGGLKKPGQMRTDATHVLAHARKTSRLVCAGETMRFVLNQMAGQSPDWMQTLLAQPQARDWVDRYGHRVEEGRVPKGKRERHDYMTLIAADGAWLWDQIQQAPIEIQQSRATEVLRRIWLQYFVWNGTIFEPRNEDDLPPAAQRIDSPHELEARISKKRDITWLGYKAHMSEVCDEGVPALITNVVTTLSTTNDFEVVSEINRSLKQRNILPATHLMDAGYVTSRNVLESQRDYGVKVIGPLHNAPDWQSKANAGYAIDDFKIDWDNKRVTCPKGQQSTKWSHQHDQHGNPIINVGFPKVKCQACSARPQCTRSSERRHITFRTKEQHDILIAGRTHQTTPEFKAEYSKRSGIEATFSTGIRVSGLRNARYIGEAKTHLQNVLTALSINFRRTVSWLNGEPLAKTRIQPFVRYAPAP